VSLSTAFSGRDKPLVAQRQPIASVHQSESRRSGCGISGEVYPKGNMHMMHPAGSGDIVGEMPLHFFCVEGGLFFVNRLSPQENSPWTFSSPQRYHSAR
jgi:hypothetical protein